METGQSRCLTGGAGGPVQDSWRPGALGRCFLQLRVYNVDRSAEPRFELHGGLVCQDLMGACLEAVQDGVDNLSGVGLGIVGVGRHGRVHVADMDTNHLDPGRSEFKSE